MHKKVRKVLSLLGKTGRYEDALRWWGHKLDDLIPINVTVTNSGKTALPEYVKNVSIYISSFKIKFQNLPFFTYAVTHDPRCSLVTHKTPNWMVITWRVDSRLSEFVKNLLNPINAKKWIFFEAIIMVIKQ